MSRSGVCLKTIFSLDTFDKRIRLGGWKVLLQNAILKDIGAVIEVIFESTAAERIDITGILSKQDG